MDSLYKNGRVRSYILIILILVSFVISVPLVRRINFIISEKIETFTTEIYEKTGLHITYDSLSPSLLSNFYIKGINVVNDDKQTVMSIDKTKINYALFKILKSNIQEGISSVVIDGINLDITHLKLLLSQYQKQSTQTQLDLLTLRQLIPSNIRIKNINFFYEDAKFSSKLNIKSILVNNKKQETDLDFKADAQVNASVFALKKNISGKVELSGNVEQMLENSKLNIKISNVTDGTYKLNKLNFLLLYANDTLQLQNIQQVNPIAIGLDYNLQNQNANLQIKAENFSPLSLFTVNSKQKELQKIQNFTFTTNTIVKCNLKEKKLDYITDIDSFIPDEIFAGGMQARLSAFGNEKQSEITTFELLGERCNANAKLNYIYETFQLSGLVEIPSFILENENVISTELYIDPLDKGFMVFSPQVFVGNRSLTALQLSMVPRQDSFDLTFEVSDYSHIEDFDPGVVKVDASYLPDSHYIQSNITLTSIYLDSIASLIAQILPQEKSQSIQNVEKQLSSFVFSGDVYASTDFNSVSYNVPYVLLANSKKEDQLLMFSMNGTEQNVQLNSLSLIVGSYAMQLSGSLDKAPDSLSNNDYFFTVDINADSIPYHFTGTIMNEICTVTGDYASDFVINLDKEHFSGSFSCINLPLSFKKSPFILSTNTNFSYTKQDGPSIQIAHFEVEGADSNTSVNPRFVLSGHATKYGAQLDSVSYTDLYSALQGTADVMLNVNGNVFDSVGVISNLKNPLTEETVNLECSVTNPEHKEFTLENFIKSYYINLQVVMKDLGLNRFAIQRNENNFITGSLNAFGTVEHPYIALNVEDMSYLISTIFLKGNGNIIVEDKDLSINELNILYGDFNIKNINAKASLTDFSLNAIGDLDCLMMNKTVFAPLNLSVSNAIVPEGKIIPDSFSATLSTTGFTGKLIKKEFPLSLSAIYNDNTFSFYSSDNAGVNGSYTLDGLLQLAVDNKQFLKFNLDGLMNATNCSLDLYDVSAELGKLFTYIDLDEFMQIQKGELTGEIIVSGNLDDPDFSGNAVILAPEVILPWLTPQKLRASQMDFIFNHNEINMQNTVVSLKSGEKVNLGFNFFMNKWVLDYISGYVKTFEKQLFPVKMDLMFAKLNGNITCDLNIFSDAEHMEVRGKCFGENVILKSSVSDITSMQNFETTEGVKIIPMYTDLDIQLGTHASVDFEPILRCVFVPNTKMNVKFDQKENLVVIDGELKLKSGDIAYLNRNFYIKSGVIDFTQSTVENPLITINAETREKDEKGQTVKIIMDVERQHLLDFVPKFSAVPAKSENEIRTMLGQIALADSSNAANFLFAASDYAIQSTVIRQAENKLREFGNFDIFSVRTNVLQNTLNMGVSGELSEKALSIGNFLDNTTVYIGKYLGSSLYLDAMLHVSFDDNVEFNELAKQGKVMFQPEFGMEVESPFANIRVNMAPDINALLNNQFVPSTSVTLSWKRTF